MVTIIPYNMNIEILPAVTAAEVAPKPFSSLKIKSSTGGCGARRTLTALGTSNAKLNLSLANSNVAIVQEEFINIWNFDPVKEVPVALGRYEWTSLSCGEGMDVIQAYSGEVPVPKDITSLKDITNPIITTNSSLVTPEVTDHIKSKNNSTENNCTVIPTTTKHESSDSENISDCENRIQGPSPRCETVLVSKGRALPKSQICITDFFRPKKLKSSYFCEDSLANKTSKKKPKTVY